jgi:L-ascorbate metabolism protein UlaG (beta-lactamase superfamily)
MRTAIKPGGARGLLTATLADGMVGLAWLGQAGFLFKTSDFCCLVDPYLSDFLARKYAGTLFPHTRLMPPPVAAEEIRGVNLVLCSHRHSDHMDPESLPVIARNNPACSFVVPRAEMEFALRLGLSRNTLVLADAHETCFVDDSVVVHALPSAHETVDRNERGEHRYLGFVIKVSGITFYHAGDSVIYQELPAHLRAHDVDVALLPINGRRTELSSAGIAGNMTFQEAVQLCMDLAMRVLIPHHFGMFSFNTVDQMMLEKWAASVGGRLQCLIPSTNVYYVFAT